jgi:hypothetical protein
VPDRRSIFRLLALAGFLLTVALALWLTELGPLLVALVMAAALAVAWAVEWLSRRRETPRVVSDGPTGDGEPVEPASPREPPPAPLPPPVLPPESPSRVEPEPGHDPAAPPMSLGEAGPPAEQEPQAPSPAPQPGPPARPPLRPVPPPPEPLPPPPTPPERVPAASGPAQPGVVDLRTRATAAPRRWNLWDLECRARDEQQRDPDRYEEWSYLFVHLRQFAAPDGSLPTEFDGLVRESFGDLLEHAG